MKKTITIAVALINILALLISSFLVLWFQSEVSERTKRLDRNEEILDKLVEAKREASAEKNFAFVHMSMLTQYPANSTILSNAGGAYYRHLQNLLKSSFDEVKPDRREYIKTKNELAALQPEFTKNFYNAIKESESVKNTIHGMSARNITRIKDRRDILISERNAYSIGESITKTCLSALQFFSLLLILIREIK